MKMNKLSNHSRGVALIIVLAMLVLLSGLIIGFFASVTTERQASDLATGSIQARQIADNTVNLAVTQIRDATSQSDSGAAWASQPGAIRTYGTASNVYKLYSAETMIEPESTYDTSVTTDSYVPSSAAHKEFGFVDLNEPAFAGDGELTYPIIHPKAKFDLAGTSTTALNKRLVEGFECADVTDPRNANAPVLPLNVRWLYVLKDGSMGTLEKLTGASTDPTKRPSRANPVVGRTAFWADDESTKININTASEGTFWDTPHVATQHELGDVDGSFTVVTPDAVNLAVAQPVQGEYQRYPGHPATTSLSPVLRRLFAGASTHSDAAYKEKIYQVIPRLYSDAYPAKTSWAANLSTAAATRNKTNPNANAVAQLPLGDDGDRLFTSVDELMFTATRRTVNGSVLENTSVLPLLTPKVLDRMRFFLTAQSRAPEMNLFGRPRVAIWPVPKDNNLRTGYDRAFAFTSTLAPARKDGTKNTADSKAYYFTRNVVAGADQSGSGSRSATLDYTGDTRNQGLFQYLQKATDADVPGFKGSLSAKFGTERDQILTEIFDYIRCTSLVDTTGRNQSGAARANSFAATPYSLPYRGTSLDANDSGTGGQPNPWSGQVMPIKIGNEHGLGRFITLSEVAVAFYVPETVGPTPAVAKEAATKMRAVLIFEFATPTGGYMGLRDTYSFKISEVSGDGLKVTADGGDTDKKIFPTSGETVGYCVGEVDALNSSFGRSQTPNRGFTASMLQWTSATSSDSKAKTFKTSGTEGVDKAIYPFMSEDISIGGGADKGFTIKGGSYRMDLYAGLDPKNEKMKVQSINFQIAPELISKVKLPKPWTDGSKGRKFEDSIKEGGTVAIFGPSNIDVVRSTAVKRGDYRLTSVLDPVPVDMFENPSGSDKATNRIVHLLRYGHSDSAPLVPPATVWGRFSQNGEIRKSKPPDLDSSQNGVQRLDNGEGDWSRGVSKHVDAPFANKPDEGNFMFDSSQTGHFRLPYMRGNFSRIADDTNFSPNRLIPSPVMFGSLPRGVKGGVSGGKRPWETLLFRPDHHQLGGDHPGVARTGAPADHLLLDLFWMPVVEPYAISEPCSTAGKINLNFVIAPFGYMKQNSKPYVQRDTGIRAVLKGAKLTAVPATITDGGHADGLPTGATDGPKVRFDIDPDLTIKDIADRLYASYNPGTGKGGLFRSASEICEFDLYPYTSGSANVPAGADIYSGSAPKNAKGFDAFWNTNNLTGDEGREQPYNTIYPRVTTKSNIFTVHLRSQAVRIPDAYYKAGATGEIDTKKMKDDFIAKGDVVRLASEYRGSATVERFIDPNDPALAAYTTGNDEQTKSLDPYYRFRIVNTKRFSP